MHRQCNAIALQCLVALNFPSVDDIHLVTKHKQQSVRCLKCHKLWMLNDPCQSFVHHNIIFRMSFAKIRPSRAREKYKGLENLFGGYPS